MVVVSLVVQRFCVSFVALLVLGTVLRSPVAQAKEEYQSAVVKYGLLGVGVESSVFAGPDYQYGLFADLDGAIVVSWATYGGYARAIWDNLYFASVKLGAGSGEFTDGTGLYTGLEAGLIYRQPTGYRFTFTLAEGGRLWYESQSHTDLGKFAKFGLGFRF